MNTENTVTSLLRTAVDERAGSLCAMMESVEVIIASTLRLFIHVISPTSLINNGHRKENIQRQKAQVTAALKAA